ncbi:MAG: hypothetical protein ACPGUD_10110 [Parashewanella sp.]
MTKLISSFGITFFGLFSVVAFANEAPQIELNKQALHQDISVSITQMMEQVKRSAIDEQADTVLIAKQDKQASDEDIITE